MELHVSHEAGYVLASTSGTIDESSANLFREYLHPLVGCRGTKVVLDLSGSGRITSSGLGELVRLVANANTNASRVVLAACTPFVLQVLSRTGLDRFFQVAASVSEGVSRVLDA